MDGNQLKLVVLNCPYEIWDRPEVPKYFSHFVNLQRLGYSRHYQNSVLPVDGSLFVSQCVLLLYQYEDLEIPVMSFRVVSKSICDRYFQKFPLMGILQEAKENRHIQCINKLLDEAEKQKKEVYYIGNWTVDPDFLVQDSKVHLKKAFSGVHYLLSRQRSHSSITLGAAVMRVHSHRVLFRQGFEAVSDNKGTLEPIESKYLASEDVLLIRLDHFSDEAIENSNLFKELWARRIEIDNKQVKEKINVKEH